MIKIILKYTTTVYGKILLIWFQFIYKCNGETMEYCVTAFGYSRELLKLFNSSNLLHLAYSSDPYVQIT